MSFLTKIQSKYIEATQNLQREGLPLGTRYPRAKRKLSSSDIAKLDDLFHKLNRTSRYTEEWDNLAPQINNLLGYECV